MLYLMRKLQGMSLTSIKSNNADFDENRMFVEIAERRPIHYNPHEGTDYGEGRSVTKKRAAYG